MAQVKTVTMSFPASASADVVSYKVYICDGGSDITAADGNGNYVATSYNIGNNTSVALNTILGAVDGVFNLGVTAVDDAGNESDMSVAPNIPLDFTVPATPGKIVIVQS
jgi:hypothetical protein